MCVCVWNSIIPCTCSELTWKLIFHNNPKAYRNPTQCLLNLSRGRVSKVPSLVHACHSVCKKLIVLLTLVIVTSDLLCSSWLWISGFTWSWCEYVCMCEYMCTWVTCQLAWLCVCAQHYGYNAQVVCCYLFAITYSNQSWQIAGYRLRVAIIG